jgi:hypothetical protein
MKEINISKKFDIFLELVNLCNPFYFLDFLTRLKIRLHLQARIPAFGNRFGICFALMSATAKIEQSIGGSSKGQTIRKDGTQSHWSGIAI